MRAIVPDTKAESNRPEGAMVTDKVSTISTYSSLDVCRTLGLLHGIAGPCVAKDDDNGGFNALGPPNVGVDDLHAY